jgi:hypothetical protein
MEPSAKRAFTYETFDRNRLRSVTDARARGGGTGAVVPMTALSELFIAYCERVALMVDLKTAALVVSREGIPTVIGWRRRGATPVDQATAEDQVLAQFETFLRERPIDRGEQVTYLSLVPPSSGMIRFERMKAPTAPDLNLLQFMAVRLSIELHRKDWRP